mgnify:CR=1 FL=1
MTPTSLDTQSRTTITVEAALQQAITAHQAGQLPQAEAAYRAILAAQPNHPDANHNLGVLAVQVGHAAAALPLFKTALEAAPSQAQFWLSYLDALIQNEQFDTAHAVLAQGRGLGLAGETVEVLAGRLPVAATAVPQPAPATQAAPTPAAPSSKPSKAAKPPKPTRGGRALAPWLKAAPAPSSAPTAAEKDALVALFNAGQFAEAEQQARAMTVRFPQDGFGWKAWGTVLKMQGQAEAALPVLERALVLMPEDAETHYNLGALYQDLGRLSEAEASYRRALALKPDYTDAHSNLLLTSMYADTLPPSASFAEHQRYGQHIAAQVAGAVRQHTPPTTPLNRPLRVGFVSADFRTHAVTYFLDPLLVSLKTQQFELFAYSNSPQTDSMTAQIRSHVTGWCEVFGLSDAAMAARIVADGIDILLDLSGHTAGNRLAVFAMRPAPVQVTWLGYPATTGVPSMDWRITDAYAEPEGLTEHLNTERLWRLPDIFCCYQPAPHAPEPFIGLPCQELSPAQRMQGLPPELAAQIDPSQPVVTLGSFNNFAKVTPPVVALWSQILARLPQARLLLEIHGGQDPVFAAEVRQRFVNAGAKPTQIHILPRKPEHQYTLYHQLDLALDPFPCVGGTTSCDSLWMGVPFVTLAGEWFVGRMGVSLLSNLGMADLIAHSPAEYADKVVTLVNDLPKLAALRHGLRERVAASPLRDGPRFAAHFGAALRGMWGAWQTGMDG